MSVAAALKGDRLSRQIVGAIVIDLLQTSGAEKRLPCAIALCTALAILRPHDLPHITFHLRTSLPAVVRACTLYLAAPRTSNERLSLMKARREDCHCDRSTSLMRDIHLPKKNAVDWPGRDVHTDSAIGIVLMALVFTLQTASEAAVRRGMSWNMKRAARDIRQGRELIWPSSLADIAPYGVHKTLRALCDWITYFPLPYMVGVIQQLYTLAGVTAYPHLMSVLIPDAFLPTVTRAIDHWNSLPSGNSSCQDCINHLETARELLDGFVVMDDIYLRAMVESNNLDVAALVTILGRMSYVYTEIGQTAGRSPGFHPPKLGFDATAMTVITLAARLHSALRLPADDALYPASHFRRQVDTGFSQFLAAHLAERLGP